MMMCLSPPWTLGLRWESRSLGENSCWSLVSIIPFDSFYFVPCVLRAFFPLKPFLYFPSTVFSYFYPQFLVLYVSYHLLFSLSHSHFSLLTLTFPLLSLFYLSHKPFLTTVHVSQFQVILGLRLCCCFASDSVGTNISPLGFLTKYWAFFTKHRFSSLCRLLYDS